MCGLLVVGLFTIMLSARKCTDDAKDGIERIKDKDNPAYARKVPRSKTFRIIHVDNIFEIERWYPKLEEWRIDTESYFTHKRKRSMYDLKYNSLNSAIKAMEYRIEQEIIYMAKEEREATRDERKKVIK